MYVFVSSISFCLNCTFSIVFRNPNFSRKSGQISTSAAAPIFGANRLTMLRLGAQKRGSAGAAQTSPKSGSCYRDSARNRVARKWWPDWPDFLRNPDFLKKSGQISTSAATPIFWRESPWQCPVLCAQNGASAGSAQTSPKSRPGTALRPEIGSLGNHGRMARFF